MILVCWCLLTFLWDMCPGVCTCRLLEEEGGDAVVMEPTGALVPKSLTIDFRFESLGLKLKGSGISVLNGVTGDIRCVATLHSVNLHVW